MLWNGIRNVICLKSNSDDKISYVVDSEGSRIHDPGRMANEFNSFFTNVGNNITGRTPRTSKFPLSYLANPNSDSFSIPSCTFN